MSTCSAVCICPVATVQSGSYLGTNPGWTQAAWSSSWGHFLGLLFFWPPGPVSSQYWSCWSSDEEQQALHFSLWYVFYGCTHLQVHVAGRQWKRWSSRDSFIFRPTVPLTRDAVPSQRWRCLVSHHCPYHRSAQNCQVVWLQIAVSCTNDSQVPDNFPKHSSFSVEGRRRSELIQFKVEPVPGGSFKLQPSWVERGFWLKPS